MDKINLLEEHAREMLGMPAEWHAYKWECLPHSEPTIYIAITGAVCQVACKSGPRKGKPNWSKLDKATDKTANIPVADHEAWCALWERRTGLCRKCTGEGKTFASWSKDEGTTYRECRACSGTGKAAAQKEGAA